MKTYTGQETGALLELGLDYADQLSQEQIPITRIGVDHPLFEGALDDSVMLTLGVTADTSAVSEQSRRGVDRSLQLVASTGEVRGSREVRIGGAYDAYLGYVLMSDYLYVRAVAQAGYYAQPAPTKELISKGREFAGFVGRLTLPVFSAEIGLNSYRGLASNTIQTSVNGNVTVFVSGPKQQRELEQLTGRAGEAQQYANNDASISLTFADRSRWRVFATKPPKPLA